MENSFTSSQISMLEGIANQCPLTDGRAVYQSRALLNLINNDVIDFNDNCNTSYGQRMKKASANNETASEFKISTSEFKIYPNPNNGSMTFSYNIEQEGEFQIWEITGKLISKHTLNKENNTLHISEMLPNGIYYYTITVNAETIFTDKLVIIK